MCMINYGVHACPEMQEHMLPADVLSKLTTTTTNTLVAESNRSSFMDAPQAACKTTCLRHQAATSLTSNSVVRHWLHHLLDPSFFGSSRLAAISPRESPVGLNKESQT